MHASTAKGVTKLKALRYLTMHVYLIFSGFFVNADL